MPSSAEELVELLDLETIDVNLFRGTQPDTMLQRVFGGQVAAQSLVAGARTVEPPLSVHSLHSYFLRPGDTAVPIVYDVERIRDGRSFSTRRVVARQHGRPIYFMTASFQVPEDGFEHQDAMPDVPAPEDSLDMGELFRRRAPENADEWLERVGGPRAARHRRLPPRRAAPDDERPRASRLWIRVSGRLDDEELTHQAAFTYASDMTLLGLGAGAARRRDRAARTCSRPRWTTRSGSTGRSAPTSGCSTTRCRRRPPVRAAWPSGGCSPRTAGWSPPSPRRG